MTSSWATRNYRSLIWAVALIWVKATRQDVFDSLIECQLILQICKCRWIYLISSVTRWIDYSLNIWPFTTMKMYLMALKFWKVDFKFCPLINNFTENCQKLKKLVKAEKFRQIWSHCWLDSASIHLLWVVDTTLS